MRSIPPRYSPITDLTERLGAQRARAAEEQVRVQFRADLQAQPPGLAQSPDFASMDPSIYPPTEAPPAYSSLPLPAPINVAHQRMPPPYMRDPYGRKLAFSHVSDTGLYCYKYV